MAVGDFLATTFPVAIVLSLLATNCALALPSPWATNTPPHYFSIANSIVFCSGLLRLLLLSTMILSVLLTGASKVFFCKCPNHLNLFSHIFAEIDATSSFSLNSWFLILSITVCDQTFTSTYAFL